MPTEFARDLAGAVIRISAPILPNVVEPHHAEALAAALDYHAMMRRIKPLQRWEMQNQPPLSPRRWQ